MVIQLSLSLSHLFSQHHCQGRICCRQGTQLLDQRVAGKGITYFTSGYNFGAYVFVQSTSHCFNVWYKYTYQDKWKIQSENKINWRNKWIKQTNQNKHTNEKERPHQKQTLSTRPTLFTLIYPVTTFLSWLLHLYLLKKIYIWNSQ